MSEGEAGVEQFGDERTPIGLDSHLQSVDIYLGHGV
jgi:hypothetical protein